MFVKLTHIETIYMYIDIILLGNNLFHIFLHAYILMNV